jgi:Na+-translocating ferredoxin:NAD+ oxidoreductase RnfC subunit
MGGAQEANHVYDPQIGTNIRLYVDGTAGTNSKNGKIVLGGLLNKEMQTVL